MKRVVLPGVVAGIVILVLGMMVSYGFMLLPTVAADYNTNIMRSWQDPLMLLFFLHPFIQGVILAWIWNKAKGLFKGSVYEKGLQFGFAIWLIASVPGMFATYTSFQLSLLTVLSWLIGGLVSSIAAGMLFAKMNK